MITYYTSYYAAWKHFPVKSSQICISNSCPNKVIPRFDPAIPDWNTMVFPSKNGDITFEEYKKLYFKQLDSNKSDIKQLFRSLESYVPEQENHSIIFLCYCKDDKKCHRSLFAEWVRDNLGIEIKEFLWTTKENSNQD